MINETDAYPLKWPVNRPRTIDRKRAPFKTTPGKARDSLMKELERLGANDIIVSTNIATYTRGNKQVMYADQSETVADPGVACYYTWKGEQYVLTCDKWTTVTDNLQAIMKTVDAIRGIERWGSGDMLKAAFQGFKELPDPNNKTWYSVLGVSESASVEEIQKAYKKLAKIHHPDAGGISDKFIEIQNAYTAGMHKWI